MELLIVIVIIAILAAITIVAYNGIQGRARDSRRSQDFSSMQQLLQLYKVDNGSYPASVPNPGSGGWEISSDPGFLTSLSAYSNGRVFADPINRNTSIYLYHTFPAGQYGCPVSMGSYAVLLDEGMETQTAANYQTNGCPAQTVLPTDSSGNTFRAVWLF